MYGLICENVSSFIKYKYGDDTWDNIRRLANIDSPTFSVHKVVELAKKARFARDRAARGWSPAYHGSCIDPMDQSKPLDPTLKVAGARRIRTIRLLVNDDDFNIVLGPSNQKIRISEQQRINELC